MFLGPDGWFGIDIGPVGAAVLYAALWLSVIHLSKHSDAAFPADAPLAERQAWVAVVFVTLVFGRIVVGGVLRSGNREAVELDERDLRIQHAANRAGSGLMAVLIIALIASLAIEPELLAPWLRPLIVANALVGLLIAATLMENVYIVVRYRREHA